MKLKQTKQLVELPLNRITNPEEETLPQILFKLRQGASLSHCVGLLVGLLVGWSVFRKKNCGKFLLVAFRFSISI